MKRRVFLFSGMSGDPRLFRGIKLPSVDLITPAHLEPNQGESLAAYAVRVAELHRIGENDVVGGASFGGMLAAQIAATRRVAGLILLGSCLNVRRLPAYYPLLGIIGALLPDSFIRVEALPILVRWRFYPITPEVEACLIAMSRDFPTTYLRRFGRMLLSWPGVEKPACPTFAVHGEEDRMIPLRCATPDLVLPNVGHVLTLTHPEQASAAVGKFLEGLA